jgi:putative transferase (TIGR04331 family)
VVSRLLVTTALEETWSDAEPMLFLGEWCRLFERRAHWSTLDAEVLPYHWDDRGKLQADYAYLTVINEELMSELALKLNEIHGVNHSVRYWRILVGPWLGYFTQMFYDRWESIQQANRAHDLSGSIVLTGNEADMVPRDMADFICLFLGDAWNHRIYGLILRSVGVTLIQKQATESTPRFVRGPSTAGPGAGMKSALKSWLSRAAAVLARDDDVFMINTYLPPGRQAALHRRLRQAPQYWHAAPAQSAGVNWAARTWKLGTEMHRGFEAAVRAAIPQQIPTTYLEGYDTLVQHVNALPWPKTPRLIWTSNAHNSDEVFKAWAAAKVDQGATLVIGQHGGHFGIGRWNFLEDHEMAICDRYFSWGWSAPTETRVVPIGQLKAKRPLEVDHSLQPNALLVTCEVPRYSYWMYSTVVAGQYLGYLEDQYAFLEALPNAVRRQVIVRLYPTTFAVPFWSQGARMRERLNRTRFDDGRAPIDDLIRKSRLYISTYNATTFLESFSMNVPTVIFWNPEHWELRDSAVPYFDELRQVGIFHDSPASAARHVAAIWDDVGGWWNRPKVQESVQRFMIQYSSLPDDLLDRIERALGDRRS